VICLPSEQQSGAGASLMLVLPSCHLHCIVRMCRLLMKCHRPLPADTAMEELLEKHLKPIKDAVQEHMSATVPASKMPDDKLQGLREAVHAVLLPVEGTDDLETLLGKAPAETDKLFDW
jgi:hypothetical protein